MKDISMFQASLKRILSIGVSALMLISVSEAGLAVYAEARPEPNRCDRDISVTPVQFLSVDELARLAMAVELTNDLGGLTFRPFDDDERPRRGGSTLLGFILARTGDIGGKPFGAVVATHLNLSINARKIRADELLLSTTAASPCRAELRIGFTAEGEVTRDGMVVGRVQ